MVLTVKIHSIWKNVNMHSPSSLAFFCIYSQMESDAQYNIPETLQDSTVL